MKFKKGDMVKIRGWAAMAEEFGEENGFIFFKNGVFTPRMKKLCGKPAIVEEVNEKAYKLRPMKIEDIGLDWNWEFTDDVLEV